MATGFIISINGIPLIKAPLSRMFAAVSGRNSLTIWRTGFINCRGSIVPLRKIIGSIRIRLPKTAVDWVFAKFVINNPSEINEKDAMAIASAISNAFCWN